MAAHNAAGALGERRVAQRLETVAPVATEDVPADLQFCGVDVEVKTATPSRPNGRTLGYQFCLRKSGHTDIGKAHVVVLVCLDHHMSTRFTYVIPVATLGNRRKLTLPMHPQEDHWLTPYRENWTIIARYIKEDA